MRSRPPVAALVGSAVVTSASAGPTTRIGVAVTEDACHVRTVTLAPRLQR